ncbi:MAG: sodium:proton exchanger [Proteobacteria bacterium]|nr:sodium:proton exchanger [Pseudomonadota bacterium]
MEAFPFLGDLVIVVTVSAGIALFLNRIKIPIIAGFLVAGALLGPHGLALVRSQSFIEKLSEVGVVLLLFTIGLEFSLQRIKDIFRQAALGGLAQIVLTVFVTYAIARSIGVSASQSLFYGFLFALSSTAVVLRALAERGESDAPHGRFIIGTLIFQDLCVVPMVLVIPLLAGGQSITEGTIQITYAMLKAAGMITGTFVLARFIVPRVFAAVDASQSREIFLLTVICLCLGTAWLTSMVGLSLALGAFLSGMIVADTEYGHRAMGDVLPLRDAFLSLFFVSLGMLFDGRLLVEKPLTVALLLAGFLLLKGLLATLSAMIMRFPARVAWLAGVGLAQFSEFGFVLTGVAVESGLAGQSDVQPVLTAGVISICVTPMLLKLAPHFSAGERILAPLERLLGVKGIDTLDKAGPHHSIKDHVVLVGYGVAGQRSAEELKARNVPFVAVELNSKNVRSGRGKDFPVFYGDASSPEALRHAHLHKARLMLVMINDPQAVYRILDSARLVAKDVPILVRTHYALDRDRLMKAGATDVIVEEIEAAHAIVRKMLAYMD